MATTSEPLVTTRTKPQYQISFDNPWTRWLAPSFSDFLFISLLVWMFVTGSAGWAGLLADADTGWHIRTGDIILATHAVPTTDPFSFSKPGAPWYAWEWLSDLMFAGAFRAAHFKGVVLLCGVIIALM